MCFAIPGQLAEVWTEPNGAKFGTVDFDGESRKISLSFLPDLQVGDYLIAHLGHAISKVAPDQYEEIMATFRDADLVSH